MKVRYVTPSGMLGQVKIEKSEKPLEYWQLKTYVRQKLQERNIEFKKIIL